MNAQNIQELLSNLKAKSYRISGMAVSFVNMAFISLIAAFLLLLVSIQFGWSILAALIFLLAGTVFSFMGFAVNAVRSVFGAGKSILFGAIVLYLHLMSSIAFGAPELFLDIGIRKWFALTIIYFIFTTGGSALLNFQKASKAVSLLIILFTLNVFFVDSQFVKKVFMIGNGVADSIESVIDRIMMKINNPEAVVKRYYEKDYAKTLNDLSEKLKRHEITPEIYRKSVSELKDRYRDKIYIPDEGVVPPANDLQQKLPVVIYDSSIASNIVDSNPVGTGTSYMNIFPKLYYFARYNGAVQNKTKFICDWYREGRLIYTSKFVTPYNNGNLWFWCENVKIPGSYEVKISADGTMIDSASFTVTDAVHSSRDLQPPILTEYNGEPLPGTIKVRYRDSVSPLRDQFSSNDTSEIRFYRIAVLPVKVSPGDEITLDAQYYVFTSSPEKELKVREIRYVRKNGENFTEPLNRNVYRKRGFVRSIATVSLPPNIPRGYYEVIIGIDDGVSLNQQNTGFYVR